MLNESIPGVGVAGRCPGREAGSLPAADADAAGGGRKTGSAPPFRALLGAPAVVLPGEPSGGVQEGGEAGADLPQVPGYEIVAQLGRGGMGVVYLARQCSLKRLVALKMILAGAHAGPAVRLRFRTEAEAVARLQHPHIVQVYEVGEHDGRPFLALEYVAGGSLGERAGTPPAEREAARLAETLARAVHYTHQRGILHRDLTPHNVLLTADGTPKVTDFGLAKLVDQAGPTRTEMLLGTPSYMSPEQAAGNARKVGVPADVYSLGAILYELLTGRAPFRGATVLDTLEQVRTREPVPPRRLRGSVSRDLQTVCLKCLEKEPGRRYASALDLADDLRRFLDGEPVRARPVGTWRRLWRSARRRPALVARALGVVALLCVLLTAGWYSRVADQLARGRAAARYRQFVERRDEALVYGLLAPDDGALFLGTGATAPLAAAESAAREALALAGVDPRAPAPAVDASLLDRPAFEVTADCYTLLLVLAGVRGEQPLSGPDGKGRYREALRLLDGARTLRLPTRAYYLRRAYLLEQAGMPEEARADRDRAAAQPPAGALDHFLIGEEQYRRADWEGARSSFRRALALEPGHFWAQFFLAVCHLKSQQWEAARAGLNACLARQPGFVWAYVFRSLAHERMGAAAEADADFQQALQLDPNADACYVLFLGRGILRFNEGELGRAAADFRSALTLKPDQYPAYLNLAQVYLARRDYERAAAEVSRALRLGVPAEALCGYHVERGRALLRDRHYQGAVRACDAALQLAPSRPLPLAVRARARLELGDYAGAESDFDEYLRAGGEARPDVFRGRGLARMKQGKYPEAAEDYTRALEQVPDAELYQHRGWAHYFADAWKLALRDFGRAIELDPDPGDALIGRGLARVMLGDHAGAVADAEDALSRRPGTLEMLHNIACIFAQAAARAEGSPASAADYRRRALEAVHRTLGMLRPDERPAFWRDKVLTDAALMPVRPALDDYYEEQRAAGFIPAGQPPG